MIWGRWLGYEGLLCKICRCWGFWMSRIFSLSLMSLIELVSAVCLVKTQQARIFCHQLAFSNRLLALTLHIGFQIVLARVLFLKYLLQFSSRLSIHCQCKLVWSNYAWLDALNLINFCENHKVHNNSRCYNPDRSISQINLFVSFSSHKTHSLAVYLDFNTQFSFSHTPRFYIPFFILPICTLSFHVYFYECQFLKEQSCKSSHCKLCMHHQVQCILYANKSKEIDVFRVGIRCKLDH